MNDIIKYTELFVNILSMSRTSSVQKWDHETIQRAFKWAIYFEQVYKEVRLKPQIAEKISKQLELACNETDVKFGLFSLDFKDLLHSTYILRKNLLENPFLSNALYLELIGQINKNEDARKNYKSRLHSLSKLKATLQILKLAQKKFEVRTRDEHSEAERSIFFNFSDHGLDKAIFPGQLTANATILLKCLKNEFNQDELTEEKIDQLHVKLKSMVKYDRGVDVLLYALILEESETDDKISGYIIEFVQDVLSVAWKENWKYFLQLPIPHLLAKCASIYTSFLHFYSNLLQYFGDQLQDAIHEQHYTLSICGDQPGAVRDEQMHKYYYYLLLKSFQILIQITPQCKYNAELLIIQQCEHLSKDMIKEKYVWKKLSHDLMVSASVAST